MILCNPHCVKLVVLNLSHLDERNDVALDRCYGVSGSPFLSHVCITASFCDCITYYAHTQGLIDFLERTSRSTSLHGIRIQIFDFYTRQSSLVSYRFSTALSPTSSVDFQSQECEQNALLTEVEEKQFMYDHFTQPHKHNWHCT